MDIPQQGIIIKKFEPRDRDAVRSITYDTAFMGEPADKFFDGKEIISDSLTMYFTDYEPESCFVANFHNQVAGCLLGAKDKIACEKIIHAKIAPALFWQALKSGILFKKKNITFIFNSLSSMAGGEFKMPDFCKEYPATLHINVKKSFRGFKIGSALMEAYINYLRTEAVSGVHLATMSAQAAGFFSRHGFSLLHQGKRSYFRHILHQDVPLYIYGKKL